MYMLHVYDSSLLAHMSVFQVEYSQRYAETNPQAQSLRHLLSEAHLLLRTSLLQTSEQQRIIEEDSSPSLQADTEGPSEKQAAVRTDSTELEEAFKQNCAQLGDCFSR